MGAAYDSRMTSRVPIGQHPRQTGAEREFARAEADYQRLRQAYLELARGQDQNEVNEVALAMVGADMERANAVLRRLGGLRELPFTHEPTQAERREARRLAEENA